MHVLVYNPETNQVYLSRLLEDHEIMDARVFADQVADSLCASIDDASGDIPNCCGDIRVEFTDDPDSPWHIWSGESFYLKQE